MKIGIFPFFSLMGEVKPALKIGRILQDSGNEVIFFSHGGKYEKLIKDFPLIRVSPEFTSEEIGNILSFHRNEGTVSQPLLSSKKLEEMVEGEVKVFGSEKIDKIISFFQFTTSISARVVKIPLFSVTAGTWTYPFLKKNLPWRSIFILRYFPSLLHPFNEIPKKFGLRKFRNLLELTSGDITLITDSPEILGITLQEMERFYPQVGTRYFYIGPLLSGEEEKPPSEIERIINSSPPRILCTMGSSTPLFYLREAYQALLETGYPSIMVTPEDKAPSFPTRDNIVTISSLSSTLLERTDLLVIHGGRTTVYWTCWAGKPFLGAGMQLEQELNLRVLEKKGMGIKLSKKSFLKRKIKQTIKNLLSSSLYKKKAESIREVFRQSLTLNKRIDVALTTYPSLRSAPPPNPKS